MNATITDPALLAQLRHAGGPIELKDPAGRSLGVVMPAAGSDLVEEAQRLAQDPLFDEWVLAVEEYRRVHNTVPDTD